VIYLGKDVSRFYKGYIDEVSIHDMSSCLFIII